MLVLSRKPGERIRIAHDIIIEVIEIRGDKVRLGIVAPKEVEVHRSEVYDAIHSEPEQTLATWFAYSEIVEGKCFVVAGSTIQQAKRAAIATFKSLGYLPMRIKLDCMGPVFETATGDNVAMQRLSLETDGYRYHETEEAKRDA